MLNNVLVDHIESTVRLYEYGLATPTSQHSQRRNATVKCVHSPSNNISNTRKKLDETTIFHCEMRKAFASQKCSPAIRIVLRCENTNIFCQIDRRNPVSAAASVEIKDRRKPRPIVG
jgi:hypothetical protein